MFKGSPFDELDLDICCQNHNPKWSLKDFSRRSLSVKKVLIKNVSRIKRNFCHLEIGVGLD